MFEALLTVQQSSEVRLAIECDARRTVPLSVETGIFGDERTFVERT